MNTHLKLVNLNNDYTDITININTEVYNNTEYYSINFDYIHSNSLEDLIKKFNLNNVIADIVKLAISDKSEFKRITLNYIRKGEDIYERSKRYAHVYEIITTIEDLKNIRLLALKNYVSDEYELNTDLNYSNFLKFINIEKYQNLILKNNMTHELIKFLIMENDMLDNYTGIITPFNYKLKILKTLSIFAE